jgi:hypothetical protein
MGAALAERDQKRAKTEEKKAVRLPARASGGNRHTLLHACRNAKP